MGTTRDKLATLISKCKCGVYVSVNNHRDAYVSVEEFLSVQGPQIPEEILKVMIDRDTIVSVCFYQHTPIGSYDVYHYDLDAALDVALDILDG